MTTTDTPWEPPVAGTEAEHLVAALDRLRATFRWKTDGLDATGLQTRIGASTLTLGGLLKHLAVCEDYMTTTKLRGGPIGPPWDTTDLDGSNDWEFSSAADDTPEELWAFWEAAVARSQVAVSSDPRPGREGARPRRDGTPFTLRWILAHMVMEYARHLGHADLVRQSIDGQVGDTWISAR